MNVVGHDDKDVEANPLMYSHVVQAVSDDAFDNISLEQVSPLRGGGGDEVEIVWVKGGTYWHVWLISWEQDAGDAPARALGLQGGMPPPCGTRVAYPL